MFKTIREANEYVGGLSAPSKMPCPSYSLPAKECPMGKIMRKVKGSVCSACYALKGRYVFPNVQKALYRRFASLKSPRWIEAFVFLVAKKKLSFFRWHDSGDLMGVWHLKRIVEVAEKSPSCSFWLPTRQTDFVKEFVDGGGVIPPNLNIRVSGNMLDKPPPVSFAKRYDLCVSSVSDDPQRINCPSYKQGGKCLDCRKCWDKGVFEIVYKKH